MLILMVYSASWYVKDIPQYMYIQTLGRNLWVGCLSEDVSNCVGVSCEGVYTGLCPHVPHTSSGVPPSSQQHIDGRVQGEAVHTTEVTMVVTYYLRDTETERRGGGGGRETEAMRNWKGNIIILTHALVTVATISLFAFNCFVGLVLALV